MDWFVPLALIAMGTLSIGIEHMLRRYLDGNHDGARQFQKNSYYSAREMADRFARRLPLSWAMIGFGLFWTITNLI